MKEKEYTDFDVMGPDMWDYINKNKGYIQSINYNEFKHWFVHIPTEQIFTIKCQILSTVQEEKSFAPFENTYFQLKYNWKDHLECCIKYNDCCKKYKLIELMNYSTTQGNQ